MLRLHLWIKPVDTASAVSRAASAVSKLAYYATATQREVMRKEVSSHLACDPQTDAASQVGRVAGEQPTDSS